MYLGRSGVWIHWKLQLKLQIVVVHHVDSDNKPGFSECNYSVLNLDSSTLQIPFFLGVHIH